MLEPQSRAAFAEELKPPPGFDLSYAVGTTFTLDLATALSVPLSFASRRVSAADDKLGILESIRQFTDRIDIFCQAGEMRLGTNSDLVALLESMIHPVDLRNHGGLFHPKVWFLKYRNLNDKDDVAYRFLCASRNLTDDRSWDILLRLDGRRADAPNAELRAQNEPLARLLRSLPDWSINPLDSARTGRVRRFARWIRDVEWEQLDGVAPTFHFFDGTGASTLDIHGTRALVISPFISDDGLAHIRSKLSGAVTLLSREEQIDRLSPESLDAKLHTYVLNKAVLEDEEDDAASRLVGLHAKALVLNGNRKARVVVGSANATGGAYSRNAEMMVEFELSRAKYGLDATWEALGELKETYLSDGGKETPEQEKLEYELDSVGRQLASVRFWAQRVDENPHAVQVWADSAIQDVLQRASRKGITVRWEMLSNPAVGSYEFAVTEESAVLHGGLDLTDISPFLRLTVTAENGTKQTTIVLAEMLGDLGERRDAIIARQLTDTRTFMRLLALMLEISGLWADEPVNKTGAGFLFNGSGRNDEPALMEAIVRAVAGKSQGLEDAKRIIDIIRKRDQDGTGEPILPPGFDELWKNAWKAHRLLQKSNRMGSADGQG